MRAIRLVAVLVGGGVAVVSTGCKKDGTTVKSVDTVVTSTQVRDTTVIKADTTIHVDTVKKTTHGADAKKP